MDLSISHGQAQRLLKQRNMLAITATGLFALSVVLTLTAAQRDREVVLQPVLAKPLTLSSSHIDKDYLALRLIGWLAVTLGWPSQFRIQRVHTDLVQGHGRELRAQGFRTCQLLLGEGRAAARSTAVQPLGGPA